MYFFFFFDILFFSLALFSSWSSFGSAIALSTDLGWNIEWHGCSLSMWLRLHRCSNTNFSSENSNIVNNNVNFHQNGTTADQGMYFNDHNWSFPPKNNLKHYK